MDDQKKCSNNHLKNVDIYCEKCSQFVCAKCMRNHFDHHNDLYEIDDFYKTLEIDCSERKTIIQDQILNYKSEIDQHKIENQKITEHYESQLDSISLFYKGLHDELHVEEVDKKRELKSHYDDNIENYTIAVSNLENMIENSNNNINHINNNLNNNNKVEFIKSYSQSNHNNNSEDTRVKYQMYSFETNYKDISPNGFVQLKSTSFVGEDDIGKFRFVVKLEKEFLVYQNGIKGNFDYEELSTYILNRFLFYQSANLENSILIFTNTHFIHIFANKIYYDFLAIPPINFNQYITSVYDDNSKVYFKGDNSGAIYEFDIYNQETKLVLNFHYVNVCKLSLDVKKKHLYLIYCNYGPDLNVCKVDLTNLTHETIIREVVGAIDYTACGCYVGKNNSFYYLNNTIGFYCYNLDTHQKTKLCDVGVVFSNPSKIQYDGNNFIYFIAGGIPLLKYSLDSNTWTSINKKIGIVFDVNSYCSI